MKVKFLKNKDYEKLGKKLIEIYFDVCNSHDDFSRKILHEVNKLFENKGVNKND